MSSVIEEIKSRLNIVDVASSYLKLEGAGGSFKARCPFHSEKSASFFISPARQTYHCFGCNRGGDLISFVEEIEGVDFSGALKILAERAGVELRPEKASNKGEKDEREGLYRALDLATKFYEAVLPKFPEALGYLHTRGLTDETIKNFRVGFAPDEWNSLFNFLTKKGVSEQTMERAGLVVRGTKGLYDRFRGRVMFPLTDMSGRVIAFSGRILKEEAGKTLGASAQAKYVNSPETEVFQKSRVLFGFSQAKQEMRRRDMAVLVEGQMDLILSHQAGVTCTVASSGTALTSEQIALIKRFTKNVVIAFDADSAGNTAALRGVGLALAQGMTVRMVHLPKGQDPADIALKDSALWCALVEEAKQVIDFYLETLPLEYRDHAVLRSKISEIVIPFISELQSSIDQGYYVGQVAKLLGVKDEPVWEEVKKRGVQGHAGVEAKIPTIPALSRKSRLARIIEGVLLWQEQEKTPALVDLKKHRVRFMELLPPLIGNTKAERPPGEKEKLIFEAEIRFQGIETPDKELEELLQSFEDELMREQLAHKMAAHKMAETRGDIDGAHKILVEYQELLKKLHVTKNF